MAVVPANLPFSVADAEGVHLSYAEGDLVLRFVDWQENPIEHRFVGALAFRWAARPSADTPRDDSTFEVLDSSWLLDEVRLEGFSNPEAFVHYVLCFNAAKVLEVISRRGTT
jgi:hypothetical protein